MYNPNLNWPSRITGQDFLRENHSNCLGSRSSPSLTPTYRYFPSASIVVLLFCSASALVVALCLSSYVYIARERVLVASHSRNYL